MSRIVTQNRFISEFCQLAMRAYRSYFRTMSLSLPDEAVLAKIIAEAWKASLETEEGRPTRLRIIYRYREGEHGDSFQFTDTRPYEAHELVRLAPAVGIEMRRLLVANVHGSLRIVGIEDHLLHSPIGLDKNMNMSFAVIEANELELTVLGPTRLKLTLGIIGLEYDKGMIREFLPAWYIPEFVSLIERLSETSTSTHKPRHPSTARFLENGRLNGLRSGWIRLLRSVRNKGHGGSLFILPTKSDPGNGSISIKYHMGMQNFANALRERGEWDGMYHDLWLRKGKGELTKKEQLQFDAFLNEVLLKDKYLTHLTDAIAAMTTVDGAVLFSADLDVLGFVARIRVRSEVAGGKVVQISVRRGKISESKRSLNSFGMRHLAAYEFAALAEGAVAFVLSEDGGVRAFCNRAGKVLLYEGLELTDIEISETLLPERRKRTPNKSLKPPAR